jgi:hypothetical protein
MCASDDAIWRPLYESRFQSTQLHRRLSAQALRRQRERKIARQMLQNRLFRRGVDEDPSSSSSTTTTTTGSQTHHLLHSDDEHVPTRAPAPLHVDSAAPFLVHSLSESNENPNRRNNNNNDNDTATYFGHATATPFAPASAPSASISPIRLFPDPSPLDDGDPRRAEDRSTPVRLRAQSEGTLRATSSGVLGRQSAAAAQC